MNCKNSNSESVITINKSHNTAFNAKGTTNNMEWSKEQLEILQLCHDEQIANEQSYLSLPESHFMMCNCVECN